MGFHGGTAASVSLSVVMVAQLLMSVFRVVMVALSLIVVGGCHGDTATIVCLRVVMVALLLRS